MIAAEYITVYLATPAVTADTVAAAVAAGCPPLDKDATIIAIRFGPFARIITAVSDQAGAVVVTKAVSTDPRNGAGREKFGACLDYRTAAVAAAASIADAGREEAVPRGGSGIDVCGTRPWRLP